MKSKNLGQKFPLSRAGNMGPLLRALDAAGANSDGLLAAHGLSRRLVSDPYEILPLTRYIVMFEQAAELLQEPTLGLRVGRDLQLSELGPAGLVFQSSSTLRMAMRKFSLAIESWQGATSMDVVQKRGASTWLYRITDAQIWPRRQDAEFSISAMCSMIRLVRGPNWNPVEVYFEHPAPADVKPYTQMFRSAVRFGQATNGMMVKTVDMETSLKSADVHLARMMERHAADLILRDAIPHTLEEQVRDLVARRMAREKLVVEDIAKDLGLSHRSLQRHLAQAGTSVRQIVRETRQRNIAALQEKGDLTQAALARAVGYADATVLWRATQNWEKSGSSPAVRKPPAE